MNPYKRQVQELREVMKNEKNRLHQQDSAVMKNENILAVLDELEKAMGPNDEVVHWPADPVRLPSTFSPLVLIPLPLLLSICKCS
jgi:hypothetical protein